MAQPGEQLPKKDKVPEDLIGEAAASIRTIVGLYPPQKLPSEIFQNVMAFQDEILKTRDANDISGMEAAVKRLNTYVETQRAAIEGLPPASPIAEPPPTEPAVQVETHKEPVPAPQESIPTALTHAVNSLYESRKVIDQDNATERILDAIPDEPTRERLRTSGLTVTIRDMNGKEVPPGMSGSFILIQESGDPSGEGWAFPTPSQRRAAVQVERFSSFGDFIARPAKFRVSGETATLVEKGELSASPPKPAAQVETKTPASEATLPTSESELMKAEKAAARGDKWALRSLLDIYQMGSGDEKINALASFVTNKEKLEQAIGDTTYLRPKFDELSRFAEAYAPEIVQVQKRNVPEAAPPTPPPTPEQQDVDDEKSREARNRSLREPPIPSEPEPPPGTPPATPQSITDFKDFDLDFNLKEIIAQRDTEQQGKAGKLLHPKTVTTTEDTGLEQEPAVLRRNVRSAEVAPEPQFTPEQMAKVDWLKTRLHELKGVEAVREFTTDEFADRANLELELQDIYEGGRGRVEPTLGEVPELQDEEQPPPEQGLGSPRADRSMLRSAVEKLTAAAVAGKEKVEWWKSSEEHLIRRNQELDAQLEKLGGLERGFRWIGEQYNKAGWKTKLAVGVALGLGSGAALATVSVPAMFVCLTGLAAQRTAALATMYLKFEKNSHDKRWGKELAMAKAMLYTAAMTGGMMYAVKEISESEWPHQVRNWLAEHWPFGTTEAPVQPEPTVPAAAPPPAAPAPPAPADTSPPAPAPAAPEIPQVEVAATAGKGYEWMAKRMWEGLEELKQQGFDGSQLKPGSDMEKLFNADASTIDKVVHDVASDPERGFFKPDKLDGTSVRINLGDSLRFNASGNLEVTNGETYVQAPEGTPVTPLYPPEPVPVRYPTPEVREMFNVIDGSPAEAPEPPPVAPQPEAPAPEIAPEAPPVAPEVPAESPAAEGPTTPAATEPEAASPTEASPEVSTPVPAEAPQTFNALDGTPVDPKVPALYEVMGPDGSPYLFAYGGTDEQRYDFMQKIAEQPKYQGQPIRWAHEVMVRGEPQTVVSEFGKKEEGGIFSFIFGSFGQQKLVPPSPETFLRQVAR